MAKIEVPIHIYSRAEATINKYRSVGSPLPPLSSQNLNMYVKELGKTFVSSPLERGMRYEVVMSFTGHKSFKTMKKYIALNEKSRKEDVERVWG